MIKFEGVEKSKSLGRLNGKAGVGVSVCVNAEVTSAEYVKDADGKSKASKAGNKQVKLNLKVMKEITKDDGSKMNIPSFMNVTYYETDYSPKLKEVKPTEKLKKFVEVKFNTGGLIPEGKDSVFGSFKVRNYIGQDGSPKNAVSMFGGNVTAPRKVEGVYTIKDFNDTAMVFEVDSSINVKVKGFIKNINDTEEFLAENYNEKFKKLKFEVFYLENNGDSDYDTLMPYVLEDIDKEKAMKFIKFVKESNDKVFGISGQVKSYAIYGEEKEVASSDFGEYSYGGLVVSGYEARVLVDYDEDKNNWAIIGTGNTGEVKFDEVTKEKADDKDFFPF